MANVIYSVALLVVMTAQSERLAAMETEEFQKALTTDTYEEVLPMDGDKEVARMPGHAVSPCEGDGPCDSNKSQEVEMDTSLQEVHDSRTTVNTSQCPCQACIADHVSGVHEGKSFDKKGQRVPTEYVLADKDKFTSMMLPSLSKTIAFYSSFYKEGHKKCKQECRTCELECFRKKLSSDGGAKDKGITLDIPGSGGACCPERAERAQCSKVVSRERGRCQICIANRLVTIDAEKRFTEKVKRQEYDTARIRCSSMNEFGSAQCAACESECLKKSKEAAGQGKEYGTPLRPFFKYEYDDCLCNDVRNAAAAAGAATGWW